MPYRYMTFGFSGPQIIRTETVFRNRLLYVMSRFRFKQVSLYIKVSSSFTEAGPVSITKISLAA